MAHRPDWYYCRDPRRVITRDNDPSVERMEIKDDEIDFDFESGHTHDYDDEGVV